MSAEHRPSQQGEPTHAQKRAILEKARLTSPNGRPLPPEVAQRAVPPAPKRNK